MQSIRNNHIMRTDRISLLTAQIIDMKQTALERECHSQTLIIQKQKTKKQNKTKQTTTTTTNFDSLSSSARFFQSASHILGGSLMLESSAVTLDDRAQRLYVGKFGRYMESLWNWHWKYQVTLFLRLNKKSKTKIVSFWFSVSYCYQK